MTSKVIVYTICKDEIIHVDEWFNRVKSADLVYVLDTGSTDGTWERLLELSSDNENLFVTQDKPEGSFNFGKYRNLSLNLAREKAKFEILEKDPNVELIYVTLDLDEFLEKDGIKKIKNIWSSDFDVLQLKSNNHDGSELYVIHKVHSSNDGWTWKRNVHEALVNETAQSEIRINSAEEITYEHKQDLTKKRNYYQLLRESFEEDPTDPLTIIYLAWESYNMGKYEDCINLSRDLIDLMTEKLEKFDGNEPSATFYEYLMQAYLNCAVCYIHKEIYSVANRYLSKGIRLIENYNFPEFRKIYFLKAQVLWELNQKERAAYYYRKCIDCKNRISSYVEDEYFWANEANLYKTLSNAEFYSGQHLAALASAEIAFFYDPDNEELQNNIKVIREFTVNTQPKEKKNKICVYAMCKNESQFVDKWLESMSEADYIVVLDTGSTDDTYELLKNDPRVYRVEQEIITPWRFDEARNRSLKLVPDDANILICTDLDETLDPGWADTLRERWIDGFHVRGTYKYAWSHLEDGTPGTIIMYDKIHDKNWYWEEPVHELLVSDVYAPNYRWDHTCMLDDKVFLRHFPDQSKSRSSYLKLLELRADEDPDDVYGKFYLMREYYFNERFTDAIDLSDELIKNYKDQFSTEELAGLYVYRGDCYRFMGDTNSAITTYMEAIKTEESFREPYLSIAECYNDLKFYDLAIGYVNQALSKTYQHYSWVERDNSWREQLDDILAVSYYWKGDKEKALYHASNAVKLNPFDQRLKTNLLEISLM